MDKPIKTYSLDSLKTLMAELGQPTFRGKQLAQWLYEHHATSYDEMTNLPQALRDELATHHPLFTPDTIDKQESHDGTRKYVLQFHDGACVETVAIPSHASHERLTVCFSTQAGCSMGCTFCATGEEGFTRNLSIGEIVDQVLLAQEDMGMRVTNIVGMGQGEPFLNYDNTLDALRILNNPKGIAIGARHITVSTCGVLPGIKRFATEPEQFTLAVSLHAARQQVRDKLMPGVKNYSLQNLKRVLQNYTDATNRRITFEYIMIQGVNDTQADLTAMIAFCNDMLCHVNLIPVNAVDDSSLQPSTQATINTWMNQLQKNGVETTTRISRGSDIAGACGQLKNKTRQ